MKTRIRFRIAGGSYWWSQTCVIIATNEDEKDQDENQDQHKNQGHNQILDHRSPTRAAVIDYESFLIHGFMESTTYHPSLNITLIPKVGFLQN